MKAITDLKGTFVLDPAHTRIGFVTRHAMVAKVRGAFNEFDGKVTFDGSDPAATDLRVTIKAASIDTRQPDRDKHLRTGDFLEAETYPEIAFVGKDFKVKGDVLEATGDLTIKNTTKPVTIPFEYEGAATDPFGNVRVGFEGSTVISRADWGITWNAALETGGVLVSDKVTLEFEVSAIQQA